MKISIKILASVFLSLLAMTTFSQTTLVSPTDDISNGTDYCDPIYIEASNKVIADGTDVDYSSEPDGYILLTNGFEATVSGTSYFQASIIENCLVATDEEAIPNHLIGEIITYPNPFTVYFDLVLDVKEYGTADLILFDETGKVFKILLQNQSLTPGKQTLHFETNAFPSGIYFYQLSVNGYRQTGKLSCIQ